MGRVVVYPYKMGSKSAKELATYLECKRLYNDGRSKFIGRDGDVIINWGSSSLSVAAGNARILNHPSYISLASNKLKAFKKMEEAGVSVPNFVTHYSAVSEGTLWVARTKLSGHSGDGIEIGFKEEGELPIQAPLYTEYIDKKYEYRAIVVGGSVVDFKQKKKRNSVRDEGGNIIEDARIEHDPHVWNLNGGYVFAREGVRRPEGVDDLAVSAVSALGLDFGAVDIIEDGGGSLYVLEVNTAFGIEGTTQTLVGEAIKEMIYV